MERIENLERLYGAIGNIRIKSCPETVTFSMGCENFLSIEMRKMYEKIKRLLTISEMTARMDEGY